MPPLKNQTCAEPSCDRHADNRDYCRSHAQQMRRWGYVKPLTVRQKARGVTCTALGCDRGAKGRGLCKMHHKRFMNHGDPNVKLRPWESVGQFLPVGYGASHERVRYILGNPAANPCVSCAEPAREWAYDGTDPTELVSEREGSRGCRYSLYPEFYMPMCIRCHRRMDLMGDRGNLFKYREAGARS